MTRVTRCCDVRSHPAHCNCHESFATGNPLHRQTRVRVSSKLPARAQASLRKQGHGAWCVESAQIVIFCLAPFLRDRDVSIHRHLRLRRAAQLVHCPIPNVDGGKHYCQNHHATQKPANQKSKQVSALLDISLASWILAVRRCLLVAGRPRASQASVVRNRRDQAWPGRPASACRSPAT